MPVLRTALVGPRPALVGIRAIGSTLIRLTCAVRIHPMDRRSRAPDMRVPIRLIVLLLAVGHVWAPTAAHAASATASPGLDTWRAGLLLLERELPNRHPAPFVHMTRARWDSACASLDRRLPAMTRNQRLVGFLQLIALLGDAHTNLAPDSTLGLRFYPLELYAFDDGLFIRRADSTHAGLVGARVVRIGQTSADEAMARVASVVPHENEWWVRAWGPLQLTIPEILDGLGLARDVEHLSLVVERDGRMDSVRIAPAGRFADQHGHGPDPIDRSHWVSMRRGPAPAWEQRPEEVFWWALDRPGGTLYVCMRAVAPAPRSFTNRSQWDQVFALADSTRPTRLVIDIRENTGGNGALNRYPVQQILRRPTIDRSDRLFVIIGRRTFSAGQQFTNLLEAWTQATLVGEPSGQRPSQYGDHVPLALPGLGLTAEISTVFHQAPNEFDNRTAVNPRLYTPLDSRSYREGVDPAMEAIVHPDTSASITVQIERAIAAGDTAAAERVVAEARGRTVNRFVSFEREINALGYRLMSAGETGQAVQVFRLNTRTFLSSANAFDSLGEALLGAGYRDAAIASYRKALEAQPGFPPSAQALARLGVDPGAR